MLAQVGIRTVCMSDVYVTVLLVCLAMPALPSIHRNSASLPSFCRLADDVCLITVSSFNSAVLWQITAVNRSERIVLLVYSRVLLSQIDQLLECCFCSGTVEDNGGLVGHECSCSLYARDSSNKNNNNY